MKNNFYIFALFLFFSCFSEPIKKEVNYSKFLKLDIIQNFESDLESNVDLIIKFPIRNLVFKKVSNSFSSDFTIDVLINGDNDEIILAHSWSENIIKKYYEDTKIGHVELVKRVSLPVGEFSLNMIVNDFYNNISWSTKSNFSVKEVKGLNNIQTFYKNNDSFLLYSESYPIEKVDTLWIEYDISDDYDDEIVFEYEFLDIILNDDFVYKDDNLDKINIITFDDEKSLSKHMQFKEVVFRKKIMLKDNISRFHIPIIEDYFNFLRIELKYKNQVIVKSFNFIDKRT